MRVGPVCDRPFSGEPTYVPPPDPFQTALQHFDAIVQRMARYLPNEQVWLNAARPGSIAEIDQWLQALYDALYRQQQRYGFAIEGFHIDDAETVRTLRSAQDRITYFRKEIADARARIPGLQQEIAATVQLATQIEAQQAKFEGELQFWSEEAKRNKHSVVRWFMVAAPGRLSKIDFDTLKIEPGRYFEPEPGLRPLPTAPLAPLEAAPSVLGPREARDPAAAPPLQGDAYAKIAAISGMQPRLDAARSELAALRTQHEANVRQAATLTNDANRLSREQAQTSEQLTALSRQFNALGEQANTARRVLGAAKRTFAYRVSEAWLWQMMKEKVVKPELRRFAREKMWFGNIDNLTDLDVDQMFERGQKVWNGWFVWRGQDNFFAVQDKTLSFIAQTKEFANEATRVAALGSPAEMQEFADRVFSRFEAHTGDLAKTALKD